MNSIQWWYDTILKRKENAEFRLKELNGLDHYSDIKSWREKLYYEETRLKLLQDLMKDGYK